MTALWQLVALWGVVVGLAAGLTALVMSATVATRWFETRRGLVIGILSAATAMGQLVFLPFMAWLVKADGWRTATLALCVFYAAAVVLIVLFIRNRPSDVGLRPFGASPDSPIAAPVATQGNLFLARSKRWPSLRASRSSGSSPAPSSFAAPPPTASSRCTSSRCAATILSPPPPLPARSR